MTVPKRIRDSLLVQAGHRCTICAERCFEVHHIIEQAEGGSDESENLIVLCPNCHQHRYHRCREFTPDQLRLYKTQLVEKNEVERRLLMTLEDICTRLAQDPGPSLQSELREALANAAQVASERSSPAVQQEVAATAQWLAERNLLRQGARRALELDWEIRMQAAKRPFEPPVTLVRVDEDSAGKAPDYEGAYSIDVILNRGPASAWLREFEREHRESFMGVKPRFRVTDNRVRLVFPQGIGTLQTYVDYLRRIVERTNSYAASFLTREITDRLEYEKARALQQFDAVQAIKQQARDIQI